jgi:hypothetical protein
MYQERGGAALEVGMNISLKSLMAPFAIAAVAALIGCGGGGGGGTIGGGGGGGSAANFFITDDLNAGYDGVWVNIHEVELINSTGTSVKVYENTAGLTVNLRALNDGASRFLFLGTDQVPAGSYSRVEITMDKALTLFTTGATTGQAATFTDAIDKSAGLSEAKFDLPAPIIFPSNGVNLVVDFDLANWTFAGGIVTPVVRRHNGQGLDDGARHENEDYKGSVTGLTGTVPNQHFTLNRGATGSFDVQLSSNTAVFRSNGTGSAALANGQSVEVRGTFETTSGVLAATDVKIEDGTGSHNGEPEVKGLVRSFSEAGGSLVVSAGQIEGFLPNQDSVNVATTASTVFFSKRGVVLTKAEFFANLTALGANAIVEAEGGTYDSGTNTLTARKIKFEDDFEGGGGSEAEARGPIANIDSSAHTFSMTLQEWEGFQGTGGGTVSISTLAGAQYKNADGDQVTQAEFFALLTTSTVVKVHGTFNNGAIAANRLEIRD